MFMISIIITAKNEEKTIGRAVRSFLQSMNNYQLTINSNQLIVNQDFEIIIIACDDKTLEAAKKGFDGVKLIKDKGKGKPMAMNLAIREARGNILIFSDGDVFVDERAVGELLKVDGDLVSGRPTFVNEIEIISNNGIYNYWQDVLFGAAHRLRLYRNNKNQFFSLSGYLFLAKRKVFKNFKFPEELLTEDEYLSYWAYNQGFSIKYAPKAMVRVKFPNNYQDFVRQKARTLGGSYQIPSDWKKGVKMRSFIKESIGGFIMLKENVKNLKQTYWILLLFLARLNVWILAWWKVRILRQKREVVWERVESTK